MLKSVLCFCLVVAFSGAKQFNKYERLQEVMTMVQNDPTLMKMYEDHVNDIEVAKTWRSMYSLRDTYRKVESLTNNSVRDAVVVHALRPENIKVIAALGDSLTAGNGILGTNILQCLTEYRGRSWSIGGDLNYEQGVRTLPNILKHFNKNLVGASINSCSVDNSACSMLNVAVPGQTSQEMPAQAIELVNRLNNPHFGVDMQNDWKMITLFIGGNDLCDYCHDTAKYSPVSYIQKVQDALDILHRNVPRAFVNLAQIFDISPLAEVSQGFFCNFVTNMVCDCGRDQSQHTLLTSISNQYQQRIEALVNSGRYDTRDDFVVVLQPFFKNTQPVKTSSNSYDLAYFAPDCFHFSEIGQNAAAKSLWNNMFQSVGTKDNEWNVHGEISCPQSTSSGLFRTKKN